MEEQICELKRQGLGINRIARKLGYASYKVRTVLLENGLLKTTNATGRPRIYSVNDSFFDSIDTEEKAYILGFLAADGCISRNKYEIGFTLKRTDKEILEKIAKAMNSTFPISEQTGRYGSEHPITEKIRLRIGSQQIWKKVQELGFSFAKSLILKFPKEEVISNELIHHFMRGYFDGDGTVFIENQSGTIRCGIISTYSFCEDFLKNLNLSLPVTISKEKRSKEDVWYFSIARKRLVIDTYNFLYKDATIYLDRKKEKFDNYFNSK
jgi:hypothetical protein